MDALKGVIITAISSLLTAILFAYLFRFPIPMIGYIGPLGDVSIYEASVTDVVKSVALAWGFYGMLGGFIILFLCGAITGVLTGRKYSQTSNKNSMIVLWSIMISTIPVFVLSILDYIFGPW
ncbi:hypothetical protein [Thalassomonas actiniarum]|uniref:Uncharacterized protein n=1 Tax=Thalassomonas actiniarum TaxID=485447 RepID=A0AAE9YMQ8_9GAMM|nr:hypothetical protein [Thalassomonas actiniarum]WDD97890.1 hypothetical protein SG35_021750 [Thalassomonas actiniarum]